METSDTQPLTEEQEEQLKEDQAQKTQEARNKLMNNPLMLAMKAVAQKPPHEHGPFTWLLNQNHNALRGCTTCGTTWTGLMSGIQESDLRWHEVQEPPEEEEE